MENEYGIAVNNKYALFLNEDEDPLDILKAQEEAQLKKKEDKTKKDAKNEKAKSAGKNKTNKKPVTLGKPEPKSFDQNANRRDDRNRGKPKQDFEKRPLKEGNRDIPPRRQERNDRPISDRSERSQNDFGTVDFNRGPVDFSEGRGRGRGRGDRRGARGGPRGRGGFDRFGKREFDRHSGSDKTGPFSSGIKPVEKREGGGAHNWGTIKDDLEDQLNETQASEEGNQEWAPSTGEEVENRDPSDAPPEDAPESPKQEDEKEMTLDEWKALQSEIRAPRKLNLRKAGEGVDEGQWKKTYLVKKKVEEEIEDDESEEESDDDDMNARRLDIQITFNDNPRRGGRGGRGRGRGGRGGGEFGESRGRGRGGDFEGRGGGRGGSRGGFPGRGGRGGERGGGGGPRREAVPNPEDESEFPSLK